MPRTVTTYDVSIRLHGQTWTRRKLIDTGMSTAAEARSCGRRYLDDHGMTEDDWAIDVVRRERSHHRQRA